MNSEWGSWKETIVSTETNRIAIHKENRKRLIRYFESGIADQDGTTTLGVEVEHFIVQDDGDKPVYYHAHDGVIGVEDILEHLKATYPEETRNSHGDLLGLANETGSITLEPASQLEISIAPYTQVKDVEAAYNAFRERLDPYLREHSCHVASCGYHPSAKALDLPLIPKERYDFMNAHFARIGAHGERMMRASCSTQVSVDYHSEADAVRKMRIATAIGPVIAYITDNVPVFEGVPNDTPLERLSLWRDVDNARCGTVPGLFEESFGFASYADWLLRTPPIFITRRAADDPGGPTLRGFSDTPAFEAYEDAPMEKQDLEHLLSMFFPDVRLKKFVEIRQADCLPALEVYGYTALIKGLYYSEDSLAALEEALGVAEGRWPFDDNSIDNAIAAIQKHGAQTRLHGRTLDEWADLLFGLAASFLDSEEAAYLAPLHARIGRT